MNGNVLIKKSSTILELKQSIVRWLNDLKVSGDHRRMVLMSESYRLDNNKTVEGLVIDIGWYRTNVRSWEREVRGNGSHSATHHTPALLTSQPDCLCQRLAASRGMSAAWSWAHVRARHLCPSAAAVTMQMPDTDRRHC